MSDSHESTATSRTHDTQPNAKGSVGSIVMDRGGLQSEWGRRSLPRLCCYSKVSSDDAAARALPPRSPTVGRSIGREQSLWARGKEADISGFYPAAKNAPLTSSRSRESTGRRVRRSSAMSRTTGGRFPSRRLSGLFIRWSSDPSWQTVRPPLLQSPCGRKQT